MIGAAHTLRALIAAITIALALLASATAYAHPQKEAQTEIFFNPRTDKIEVAHRFSLHDADYALRETVETDGELYTSPETRDAFAAYVSARFAITSDDGTAIALDYLGSEIADGYLWIYQEGPMPSDPGALRVRHEALRDVWPEQVNRVNIQRDDAVRTLIFSGTATVLRASFDD